MKCKKLDFYLCPDLTNPTIRPTEYISQYGRHCFQYQRLESDKITQLDNQTSVFLIACLIYFRITLPLPKTASPTSPRVILMRLGQYDPNKYTTFEIASVSHSKQLVSKFYYRVLAFPATSFNSGNFSSPLEKIFSQK